MKLRKLLYLLVAVVIITTGCAEDYEGLCRFYTESNKAYAICEIVTPGIPTPTQIVVMPTLSTPPPTPTFSPTFTPTPVPVRYCKTSVNLNVRSLPSASASVVGGYTVGQTVTLYPITQQGDFEYVSYPYVWTCVDSSMLAPACGRWIAQKVYNTTYCSYTGS